MLPIRIRIPTNWPANWDDHSNPFGRVSERLLATWTSIALAFFVITLAIGVCGLVLKFAS